MGGVGIDKVSVVGELQQIDELLKCGICYEYLKTAVITACSHNYCSLCIRQYINYKTSCPACFAETVDSDLRPNRALDNIVSLFPAFKSLLEEREVCVKGKNAGRDGSAGNCSKKISSDENSGTESNDAVTTSSNGPSSPEIICDSSPVTPGQAKTLLKTPISKANGACQYTPNKTSGTPRRSLFSALDSIDPSTTRSPRKINLLEYFSPKKPTGTPSSFSQHLKSTQSKLPFSQTQATSSQKSREEAQCPVCGVTMLIVNIDRHLDACFKRHESSDQRKQEPTKSRKQRQLSKPVYHLLKDGALKTELRRLGLPVSGNRDALIKRHKRYIELHNSECDKEKPRSAKELVRLIEREEQQQGAGPSGAARPASSVFKYDSKSAPEVIEKEQEKIRKKYKNEFSALIADVKRRRVQTRNKQTQSPEIKVPIKSDIAEKDEISDDSEGLLPTSQNPLSTILNKRFSPKFGSQSLKNTQTIATPTSSQTLRKSKLSLRKSTTPPVHLGSSSQSIKLENNNDDNNIPSSSCQNNKSPYFNSVTCKAHKDDAEVAVKFESVLDYDPFAEYDDESIIDDIVVKEEEYFASTQTSLTYNKNMAPYKLPNLNIKQSPPSNTSFTSTSCVESSKENDKDNTRRHHKSNDYNDLQATQIFDDENPLPNLGEKQKGSSDGSDSDATQVFDELKDGETQVESSSDDEEEVLAAFGEKLPSTQELIEAASSSHVPPLESSVTAAKVIDTVNNNVTCNGGSQSSGQDTEIFDSDRIDDSDSNCSCGLLDNRETQINDLISLVKNIDDKKKEDDDDVVPINFEENDDTDDEMIPPSQNMPSHALTKLLSPRKITRSQTYNCSQSMEEQVIWNDKNPAAEVPVTSGMSSSVSRDKPIDHQLSGNPSRVTKASPNEYEECIIEDDSSSEEIIIKRPKGTVNPNAITSLDFVDSSEEISIVNDSEELFVRRSIGRPNLNVISSQDLGDSQDLQNLVTFVPESPKSSNAPTRRSGRKGTKAVSLKSASEFANHRKRGVGNMSGKSTSSNSLCANQGESSEHKSSSSSCQESVSSSTDSTPSLIGSVAASDSSNSSGPVRRSSRRQTVPLSSSNLNKELLEVCGPETQVFDLDESDGYLPSIDELQQLNTSSSQEFVQSRHSTRGSRKRKAAEAVVEEPLSNGAPKRLTRRKK